jgi:hypothetical protein
VPNSTIADSKVTAKVQIAESSLPYVPSMQLTSSSSEVAQELEEGSHGVYMGIGQLVKVGTYDTAIMIGKKTCVNQMPELYVDCRAGFKWDGRRCVKARELSVCFKSNVSLGYQTRESPFSAARSALIGSVLAFRLPEDRLQACMIQLVPVPKAAHSFPACTRAAILWTGKYSLRGKCDLRAPCSFSKFGELRFVCPPTHRQVGQRCERLVDRNCSGSFIRLEGESDQSPCKRLPLLTISTASSTYIVAQKMKGNGTQDALLSAKLVSGVFDVDWAADCPNDVQWLECVRSTGRLAPRSPVDEMTLRLNTKDQLDYSCTVGEDQNIKLPFSSRAKGLASNTTYDGQTALLPVTVRFVSIPYLEDADVSIFSISTGLVKSRTKYTRDTTAGAFLLPWGDNVEIEVRVYDLDRLPINRSVGLVVTLPGGADKYAAFQQTPGSNLFSASLPNEWWFAGADRYRIAITSSSTELPLLFELDFQASTIVKVAIAATLSAGLVGLVFILGRMVLRAGDRTEARQILLSFLQFELLLGFDCALELWDLCRWAFRCTHSPRSNLVVMFQHALWPSHVPACTLACALLVRNMQRCDGADSDRGR